MGAMVQKLLVIVAVLVVTASTNATGQRVTPPASMPSVAPSEPSIRPNQSMLDSLSTGPNQPLNIEPVVEPPKVDVAPIASEKKPTTDRSAKQKQKRGTGSN
jgi:hypothetical protein